MHTITAKVFVWLEFGALGLLAAIADIESRKEVVTPDELVIFWCLIGGLGGSICSLHFYPARDKTEGTWQFVVNIILSGIFSPIVCDWVSYLCHLPIGLRLALPVSCSVGFFACQAIWQGLPYVRRWYRAWWNANIDEQKHRKHREQKERNDDSDHEHRTYDPHKRPNPYRQPQRPASWDDMKG